MDTLNRYEVESELANILGDAKFVAAPQMSAFLKFVVEQTLDGRAERIKAFTVAVDALGKPPTFDPQNDPSVRVLAKRLRDSLTAYYERTDGHNVVIQIKSGSYVPKFLTPAEAMLEKAGTNVVGAIAPLYEQPQPVPGISANVSVANNESITRQHGQINAPVYENSDSAKKNLPLNAGKLTAM